MVVLWLHCLMILKNKASKSCQFFFLCLLTSLFFIPYSFAESTQTLKKQELQQLRQKIKLLQKNLTQQQGEKSQLQKEIKKSEQIIADNARQYFHTQTQSKKLNKQLSRLNKAVLQQNKQLSIQQLLLSEQIEASYAIGRQEYLKLLLNQEDMSAISRVMIYYKYFNEARQKQIEIVNELLRSLEDDKYQIALISQTIRDKQLQLQREKQVLDEQQQQRNKLVAQLKTDIHYKSKELANLQENKKNLTALLKKLTQTMQEASAMPTNIPDKLAFKKQKGKLTWPAKGKVKNLYGHWRSVGKVKWQGIIISAKEGTAVHAISRGRVAYSDWLRGYGLISIIDHGKGYMSLYGHNQTLLKEVGDWVDSNEVIATVGSSGGLKKSGLYFEVRHNSKAANPTKWCKKQRR